MTGSDLLREATEEAEASLMAVLVQDPHALGVVMGSIEPETFANRQYGAIYRAMRSLWQDFKTPDLMTIPDELVRLGLVKRDITAAKDVLLDLYNRTFIHATQAEEYARRVLGYAEKRAMQDAAGELAKAAYDPSHRGVDAVGIVRSHVDRFQVGMGPVSYADAVPEWREDLIAVWEHRSLKVAMPTGIAPLDRKLGSGFVGGQVIILGARTGMGKTSMAMQMAHGMAVLRPDHSVVIFSAEMERGELIGRGAAAMAGISYEVMKRPGLDQRLRDRVINATGRLEQLPIRVDDDAAITTAKMQARITTTLAREPVSVVILDHLHMLQDASQYGSRYDLKVREWMGRLKIMAKELKLPIILLCQLKRLGIKAGNAQSLIPTIEDLRESGAIEEFADVVMLLHRRGYYAEQGVVDPDPDRDNHVELMVAKHRNGPQGVINLIWEPETMTFKEFAA